MTHEIRYSPHPVSAYVRTVNGTPVGPGADPRLLKDAAAWNLFFLSFPEIEKRTDMLGGLPLWPHENPVTQLAHETAQQFVGNVKVRDLAVYLTPDRFIVEMEQRPHEHLALAQFFKDGLWLRLMRSRLPLYVPDNVPAATYIAGSVLTRQQDGTGQRISTNILPLSKVFQRRLH